MEMAEFGMDQGHIHRGNKCLSKARRLANVGMKLCVTRFFEAESLLHMGTNTKKEKRI